MWFRESGTLSGKLRTNEGKNLIWCMCRECLPTRMRFQSKGAVCPPVLCATMEMRTITMCFVFAVSKQVSEEAGLLGTIRK